MSHRSKCITRSTSTHTIRLYAACQPLAAKAVHIPEHDTESSLMPLMQLMTLLQLMRPPP